MGIDYSKPSYISNALYLFIMRLLISFTMAKIWHNFVFCDLGYKGQGLYIN